jgi:transposase
MLSPEEIDRISHSDPDSIKTVLTQLVARIEQLEYRVKELERQLGQNSTNSNWPSSRDVKRKPQNHRTSGGKKGGPTGHPGNTLLCSSTPDEVVTHSVFVCTACAASLAETPSHGYETRQVWEMPQPVIHITEHRAVQKRCPCCHKLQKATFPKGVNARVQYGPRFTAMAAYLHTYQILPLARTTDLIHVLTGCKPSEATLLNGIRTMAEQIAPYENIIREGLLASSVIHSDETGIRVNKNGNWVHVASADQWTLFGVHSSRGSEGMKALNVLPQFKGTVMHDCYKSYLKQDESFRFEHALCNAHLTRECKGIVEYDNHRWANEMHALLHSSWEATREARRASRPLAEEVIQSYEQRYDAILQEGREEWERDPVPEKKGPQGRKSKTKAGNLWQRFLDHKAMILGFLRNADLPFDNNQAERALRMIAVKRKISGCFRSPTSPAMFATIRSFISTLIKQNRSILPSLEQVMEGSFSF